MPAMDAPAPRKSLLGKLWPRRSPEAPSPAAIPLGLTAPASVPPPPAAVRASAAVAWFRLGTSQGKVLTLRGMPPQLSFADAVDPAHAILAVIPAAMPHVCLLVAPDARPFRIVADPTTGIAASAIVLQTDAPGVIRLKYPIAGPAFLIAMHDDAAQSPPAVRFDGAGTTLDVAFALLSLSADEVSSSARALGTELGQAAAEYLRAESLMARLDSGALRPELIEALIRVMPRDEQSELARLLLVRPRALAQFGRAMPASDWIGRMLPALAQWQQTRADRVDEAVAHSPVADGPLLAPLRSDGLMPATLALHSLARRHVLPRRMACIVATAKNEGVYLLDWIAYHLSIGFEHIFLYTNDNDDGSDELLAALDSAGVISWLRNERAPPLGAQDKAYAHALSMLPQILDYRWTAIVDLDEYIGFEPGMFTSIVDYIGFQEAQSVDAIALSWLLFASLPGESWSEQFTPARMLLREREANKHVKSIFRPRQFAWSRPHDPVPTLGAPFEFRASDGRLHHHAGVAHRVPAFAELPSSQQAWIAHYFVRTTDEVFWKWSRGRSNWINDSQRTWFLEFLAQNFFQLARPERLIRDTRILQCAGGQPAMREKLLALPGMAEAQARVVAQFTAEVARIRGEFLASPVRAGEHDIIGQLRAVVSGEY